jgi:hypothetical protein
MNDTVINKSLADKFINEIHEAYQKKEKEFEHKTNNFMDELNFRVELCLLYTFIKDNIDKVIAKTIVNIDFYELVDTDNKYKLQLCLATKTFTFKILYNQNDFHINNALDIYPFLTIDRHGCVKFRKHSNLRKKGYEYLLDRNQELIIKLLELIGQDTQELIKIFWKK